ncbi:class I SAM-dependent methyltransferase [Moraxella catarrhalis]|nr:Tellurite resistance protein-related protein [Moraxella catarrhalis]RKM20139.1 class I SAM-dependent methyltransferase [Moraxella catarrhalis]RKM32898.1 class I SAM-dependent methyltransferase [Moraxella catarrhalis]
MAVLDFYQTHAKDFFNQTINVDMHNIYQPFLENLPSGKQIISDIGCGSGRDSVFFAKQGFQVMAIDGSQNLIELAKQNHPTIDWQCLAFNEIKNQNWHNKFTGIWACASLLHVPFDELPNILNDLLEMLKPNGILYASFKYGDSEREKDGRFFCDMNESRWQLVESELQNMKTLKIWQTVDNRKDRQEVWLNILLGN